MKRSLLLVSFFAMSLLLFSQERVYTPALRSPADSAVKQMPNVYLSWYAITGSLNLKYQVQLDTTGQFLSPLKDTTLLLLTGYQTRYLTFNQTYYWHVRAIDNGNTSAWSPTWSFTVFNVLQMFSPPTPALNDTGKVPNLTIKWDTTVAGTPISGVSAFDFQIDSSLNFNSPLLVSVSLARSVNSFTTSNLRFGVYYYWRVRAKHTFGKSSWGQAWSVTDSYTTANLSSIFFNSTAGYIVGDGGTILKTSNGGTSWSSLNSGTTQNLKSVYFKNNSTGIVASQGGTILWTKNSGTTWKTVTSGTTNNLSCVYYPGISKGYITGDAGTILYTRKDTTWVTMASGTSANLKGIFFVNPKVGFIAGDNGTILSTTDSTNWVPLNSGTTQNLSAVYFLNATTGFVVGNSGTILKTTNGGATWTNQFSGTTNNLYSIKFPVPSIGYIAGAGGTILKTNNGGITWFRLPGVTSYNLNSLIFTNNVSGYVVGQNGIILGTGTGGVPWSFKVITRFVPLAPVNGATKQMLDAALTSTMYTGLLAYIFQVAEDPNFTNIVFQTETGGQDSSVNASYLRFGKEYYWRVAGRHLTDTSEWSLTSNFTTINTVDLTSPANNAQNVALKPQLVWVAQTGIAGFILQLDSSPAFTNPLINIKPNSTDKLYNVVLKLSQGTTYYWRMKAFSDGTLIADTTDWSPVWSFTTVGPQGINEPGNPSFKLYPNPSAGKVFLELNSHEFGTLHFALFDLLGGKIFDRDIEHKSGINSIEINLSGIREGIYIARITSEGVEFNQKIIINK